MKSCMHSSAWGQGWTSSSPVPAQIVFNASSPPAITQQPWGLDEMPQNVSLPEAEGSARLLSGWRVSRTVALLPRGCWWVSLPVCNGGWHPAVGTALRGGCGAAMW